MNRFKIVLYAILGVLLICPDLPAQVYTLVTLNARIKNQALIGSDKANELTIAGANASSGPSIVATGSDTNVDIVITPKGSGRITSTKGITTTGTIIAGTGPTTLTAADGTLLNAALPTAISVATVVGTTSTTSLFIHAADGTQTIAGMGALTLTAGKALFPVAGMGGAVTGVTIGNGTTAGTSITVVGTHDTNTVQFAVNGATNIAAENGVTTRTLGNHDLLVLMWDGTAWAEIAFKNNL